jgi:hypothetical protein
LRLSSTRLVPNVPLTPGEVPVEMQSSQALVLRRGIALRESRKREAMAGP